MAAGAPGELRGEALPGPAAVSETWRLVAAAPGVEGPFDDVDDFRRRGLMHVDRRMRVIGVAGRRRPRIAITEDYAIALDATELTRRIFEGKSIGHALPRGAFDPALLRRARPLDILALLPQGPLLSSIDEVVLLDEPNPADAWYRQSGAGPQFASAASASAGRITFYRAECDPFLRKYLFHELAHLIGEQHPTQRGWFDAAAALEAGGYAYRDRAAADAAETWAVHLGECVLGDDDEAFLRFCRAAPLRAAVLGVVLAGFVEGGPDREDDTAFESRAAHLATTVRAAALADLRARITLAPVGDAAGAASISDARLNLLLALAHGASLEGFSTLSSLDLAGSWVNGRTLHSLAGFTALAALDLSNTPIGRGTLVALRPLTALRRLDLRGTGVWSSDMRALTDLPRLEWLDVSGSRIGVSALPEFLRMTSLRFLQIAGTDLAEHAAVVRAWLAECVIES